MVRTRFWLAVCFAALVLAGCSMDPAPAPSASASENGAAQPTAPAPVQRSTDAGAVASSSPAANPGTVSGQITYLQRSALPPEARITVWLEDVSFADAPAMVLAEQSFIAGGKQVPFPFELPYRQADIDARNRYNVRVEITLDEQLLFVTTMAYPVITGGNPTSGIEVLVDPIDRR